jgi:prolyl 4-hydroxylase
MSAAAQGGNDLGDNDHGVNDQAGNDLDGTWPTWLRENLERRCDPEQLLAILMRHGFSPASIRAHMGASFPDASPLVWGRAPDPHGIGPVAIDYEALARIRLTRPDTGLNAQQLLSDRLQLYLLDDFMSAAECARLARIANRHLRPSTVTTGHRDRDYRSSRTCDIGLLDDPEVAKIDERIARTLGIQLACSESTQAQRYDVGQEFRIHTDYFEPGSAEFEMHALGRGQRTWTFMVYLNDGMKGGGTKFHAVEKVITPKRGLAVVWNNLLPDGGPNSRTTHSGLPLEGGHKIIITKWFRDRPQSPDKNREYLVG